MARKRKLKPKRKTAASRKVEIPDSSWTWQWQVAAFLGLLIMVIMLYHPLILSGMMYPTGDTIAEIVNNHQILQYMQLSGETLQWNPYPWGGMPNVFYLPRSLFSPDFYLHVLSDVLTFPLVFSMVGAMGMYFLLRFLRQSKLSAFFGAALFLLLPYQKSLIIAGHLTKYEAAMYVPWIILGTKAVLTKNSLVHILGLALAVALQLRAGHYQVSFYAGVIVVVILVAHIWSTSRKESWQVSIRPVAAFAIAGVAALLLAAQPLLLAGKFAADSVRGGQVERLDRPGETTSSGVAKDFVAEWSFDPMEMLTVVVPHAVGGTSDHRLTPALARRFNQKVIATYWGPAPFNTSFYYLGILPLLLLLLGLLSRPSWFQKSLLILLILMLVWAMGTNADPFYSLCYAVLPFFKNFRTPTTSFTAVNALLPILAVYGINSIKHLTQQKVREAHRQSFQKLVWVSAGLLFAIILIGSILSFEKPGQNIADNALQLMREIRQGLFYGDVIRIALLMAAGLGALALAKARRVSTSTAAWAIVVLTIVDLGYQNTRYGVGAISSGSFHDKYLAGTSAIDFLHADAALYRVMPFASGNLGLPYHVQTIGGGLELQMNKYAYEVYYNNLHQKLDGSLPINWNVLDALNVKYVLSNTQIDHPNLRPEHTDPSGKYVYRYKFNVERGYFVDGYKVVEDDRERLEMLNQPNLDLRRTAILETIPTEKVLAASRSKVDLVSQGIDHVTYTVEAEAPGLFVLSELYAPESQQVYLDGELVSNIYKTNHLVQSIIVPKGLHTIELKYASQWYPLAALTSKIAFFVLMLLAGLWGYRYRKKTDSSLAGAQGEVT
ncbi:MAG: hypothetical protein HKN87_23545 [Saprospiraceae bacterium]|nr:hypothetical protein [Saprospiraceae bacterium]